VEQGSVEIHPAIRHLAGNAAGERVKELLPQKKAVPHCHICKQIKGSARTLLLQILSLVAHWTEPAVQQPEYQVVQIRRHLCWVQYTIAVTAEQSVIQKAEVQEEEDAVTQLERTTAVLILPYHLFIH
jgi:hypothetical protein